MTKTLGGTIFAVAALLSCPMFGQQEDQSQRVANVQTSTAKTTQAKTTQGKATRDKEALSEDQQLGLQILEVSEATARGFEPPMRSYSLLQIAQTYLPTDKTKAAGLLRDAFTASLGIRDDDQTKSRLQESILQALLPISQSDVEERLPQAEPSVRKGLSEAIIRLYSEKKEFAPAIELINRLTAEAEFPYASGTTLVLAMPADMSAEKQNLFAMATSSYGQHKHKGVGVGGTLTEMVVRFGAQMYPKLALEAIDEILKQAKESDEAASITIGSDAGTVAFDSGYQYQLFSLLPILRQLDEKRAESLLNENQALQAKLAQFPNGLQSLNPALTGSPSPKGRSGLSTSVHSGNTSAAESTQAYMRQEWQRRAEAILQDSEKDPVQAIAEAMTLPAAMDDYVGSSPRAHVYEGIAKTYLKSKPGVAKQALDELRKTAVDLPQRSRVVYLAMAADLYVQMGDMDTAESVVTEGFKAAGKMLEKDNNADDPNKALKAWWPSVDAYRRFIEVETKISHRSTANILKEIEDPEIRAVESIMVARILLGVPLKQYMIVEQTKNNRTFSMSGP